MNVESLVPPALSFQQHAKGCTSNLTIWLKATYENVRILKQDLFNLFKTFTTIGDNVFHKTAVYTAAQKLNVILYAKSHRNFILYAEVHGNRAVSQQFHGINESCLDLRHRQKQYL